MALKKTLKGLVERIPYPIGRIMALVPFGVRLGKGYAAAKAECRLFDCSEISADRRSLYEAKSLERCSIGQLSERQEGYAVEHFRKVFEYAREKFPCYRELYAKAGVLDLKIESVTDIQKVPIVDKRWTREHFAEFKGAYRLNTGGSSGEPTAFWMDKECWAREWAHMHTIWEKLGYKYTDLKLAIRGKNLGKRPFAYNPVHNEYIINTYLAVKDYADDLKRLFQKRKPKWFHGYPSSIYQFILECESAFGEDGTRQLFKGVIGLLLSSEYPHPYIVQKFESYGLKWISWYGHSEMAVLAYGTIEHHSSDFASQSDLRSVDISNDPNNQTILYHPFVTYGLTEIVNGHLIGTSYHNFDMPLIRYDTGDLVEKVEIKGGGFGFRIKEGRSGDFVEDKNGKKIPLTALIFGRHHKAFDIADHVQIRQQIPGKATLIVSGSKEVLAGKAMADLFDLTNVAIDFDMEIVDKPIRTAAGKLKLKV